MTTYLPTPPLLGLKRFHDIWLDSISTSATKDYIGFSSPTAAADALGNAYDEAISDGENAYGDSIITTGRAELLKAALLPVFSVSLKTFASAKAATKSGFTTAIRNAFAAYWTPPILLNLSLGINPPLQPVGYAPGAISPISNIVTTPNLTGIATFNLPFGNEEDAWPLEQNYFIVVLCNSLVNITTTLAGIWTGNVPGLPPIISIPWVGYTPAGDGLI